jgi:hypothetical protein
MSQALGLVTDPSATFGNEPVTSRVQTMNI